VTGSDSASGLDPTSAEAQAVAMDTTPLRSRLERLQGLDGAALREEWRRHCRSEPLRVSRDLLLRAVAYRLQEMEHGGLPKWARQSLAGSAIVSDPADADERKARTPRSVLKPGARIVREWHSRTHSVVVLDDGFEF
jgi:hypothetical protein